MTIKVKQLIKLLINNEVIKKPNCESSDNNLHSQFNSNSNKIVSYENLTLTIYEQSTKSYF